MAEQPWLSLSIPEKNTYRNWKTFCQYQPSCHDYSSYKPVEQKKSENSSWNTHDYTRRNGLLYTLFRSSFSTLFRAMFYGILLTLFYGAFYPMRKRLNTSRQALALLFITLTLCFTPSTLTAVEPVDETSKIHVFIPYTEKSLPSKIKSFENGGFCSTKNHRLF